MNDYKVKRDLPMHKDVYFFGHGIDIDNPYEMDLKMQKQELINYLKGEINECKLTGNDEDYIKIDVYEEILSKIEKE